ncbi:hypothetical protein ACIQ1D_22825 [Lysinibacillus xylanilyticus]|uniref:hypothetical protein n=1 Tax=Lysinibacillus xylanilyticus TaxID=582475 RepID=UPI00382F03C3
MNVEEFKIGFKSASLTHRTYMVILVSTMVLIIFQMIYMGILGINSYVDIHSSVVLLLMAGLFVVYRDSQKC